MRPLEVVTVHAAKELGGAERPMSGNAGSLCASPPPMAVFSARGALRRTSVWWGLLVDEPTFHGLIREIETNKARLSIHEAECAGRYQGIHTELGHVKTSVSNVETMVAKLAQQGQNAAWSANWKAWMVAVAIGAGLLGGLAWTAGQLYALEPLRVAQETKK